jgi:hypothetical protein
VQQFAEILKVPIDRLLLQLRQAGLPHRLPNDLISSDQKVDLLKHLRRSHEAPQDQPVSKPSPKGVAKTLDVAKTVPVRQAAAPKVVHAPKPPVRVFVSYSWDNEAHRKWVKDFATQLRANGVEAILDQWEVHPGDAITHFMEKSVVSANFVVMICTSRYKKKADAREGGVGYEGGIISAELYRATNRRKYVPLLRGNDWADCAPVYLQSSAYIDVRSGAPEMAGVRDLLLTIYGRREAAPPIGHPPAEFGS